MDKKDLFPIIIIVLIIFSIILYSFLFFKLYNYDYDYENVKFSNTYKINMPKEFDNIINSRYDLDKDEFLYCLYGDYDNDVYTITDLKITSFISNSTYLEYDPCVKSSNLLGTIHSHLPQKNLIHINLCSLSHRDIYTFGGSEDEELMGVICGKDKIAFYTSENLKIPITYKII